MITINFQAKIGVDVRRRIILPALINQDKPFLIVSLHSEILDINWPEIADNRKITLPRFLKAVRTQLVADNALILIEEMWPRDWIRISDDLNTVTNEIWTINRVVT